MYFNLDHEMLSTDGGLILIERADSVYSGGVE